MFSINPVILLSAIISYLLGSFVFWKKLREEFVDGQILKFSLVLFVLAIAGAVVWQAVGLTQALLGAGIFVFGGYVLFVRKVGWKTWDIWDSLVEACIFSVIFFESGMTLLFKFESLSVVILSLFCLLLGRFVAAKYKSWSWYKSGKVGIVGLAQLCLFLVGVFALATINARSIYWSPYFLEPILIVVLIVTVCVVIYTRSGRTLLKKKIFHG